MGRIILFGSPTQTLPQGESFKYNEYYTPCCCAPLLLLVATRGLTVEPSYETINTIIKHGGKPRA